HDADRSRGAARVRNADGERGSLAAAGALGPDRTTVRLDQVADDGEAEPQATVAARVGAVDLVKPVENVRQLLGADALAGVTHGQLDELAGAAQPDVDLATGRRELHRVGHEIRDDLVQPVAVS